MEQAKSEAKLLRAVKKLSEPGAPMEGNVEFPVMFDFKRAKSNVPRTPF